MSTKGIMHIDEYIKRIAKIVNTRKTDSNIVLYRGEPQNYPTPCVPNIFRENFIKNYKYFEKNIFDEMKANNLSKGNSYLEKAISAQHDGFPSRLLDVTYNSLIALYFACTPYYRKKEDEYDDKDGKVFIFFLDKMFCPTGGNITNAQYRFGYHKRYHVSQAATVPQKRRLLFPVHFWGTALQARLLSFECSTTKPIIPAMCRNGSIGSANNRHERAAKARNGTILII